MNGAFGFLGPRPSALMLGPRLSALGPRPQWNLDMKFCTLIKQGTRNRLRIVTWRHFDVIWRCNDDITYFKKGTSRWNLAMKLCTLVKQETRNGLSIVTWRHFDVILRYCDVITSGTDSGVSKHMWRSVNLLKCYRNCKFVIQAGVRFQLLGLHFLSPGHPP